MITEVLQIHTWKEGSQPLSPSLSLSISFILCWCYYSLLYTVFWTIYINSSSRSWVLSSIQDKGKQQQQVVVVLLILVKSSLVLLFVSFLYLLFIVRSEYYVLYSIHRTGWSICHWRLYIFLACCLLCCFLSRPSLLFDLIAA